MTARERPILFSAPMVRAILAGTKTQTRRIVKPPLGYRWLDMAAGTMVNDGGHKKHVSDLRGPYGAPGDRLWVRETWVRDDEDGELIYRADVGRAGVSADSSANAWERGRLEGEPRCRWRPSIYMPREASRIDLEVTGVRVERLQEMEGQGPYPGESDALAEGVHRIHHGDGDYYYSAFRDEPHPENWSDPTDAFSELWGSINGAGSWATNPWVRVCNFKRIKP